MTDTIDDSLNGRMPVDYCTGQPGGVLHGGASVALAETLASRGATLTVDPEKFYCVGMERQGSPEPPLLTASVGQR